MEFHQAVREGNAQKVLEYLQDGIDPNEATWYNNGRPSLLEAVYHGHIDVVKLLLDHGADPTITNAQGETAVHFALHPQTFNSELIELLIENSNHLNNQEKFNGFTVLHVASRICATSSNKGLRSGILAILPKLCEKCDVGLQNKSGDTALHRTASGTLDLVEPAEVLIRHGADVDVKNDRGETSLMGAIDKGHFKIAELLIKGGCNVNIVDRHCQTTLHRCAQKNLHGLLVMLLKNKADVNVMDLNGDTALHIAACKGLADMVRVLVYHPRANVNVRNMHEETPLHNAIESGFANVVEVLLEAECEIDSDDEDLFSKTGLADECYVRRCYPEICSMLRDAIEQRKDWDVGETSL